MPDRTARKRELFLSVFRSFTFRDLRREFVVRQRIQEVQSEGDTGHTCKDVCDRIDCFDTVDPEEIRENENARDEVNTLSEAGKKRCLETFANRLECHVTHDIDSKKRQDECFETECPGTDGDNLRVVNE